VATGFGAAANVPFAQRSLVFRARLSINPRWLGFPWQHQMTGSHVGVSIGEMGVTDGSRRPRPDAGNCGQRRALSSDAVCAEKLVEQMARIKVSVICAFTAQNNTSDLHNDEPSIGRREGGARIAGRPKSPWSPPG